jgi:hypothetical protein
MKTGPLPDTCRALPGACRTPAGRHETGLSLRQDALDPGFHGVPNGSAHPFVMLMVPV